MTDTKANAEGDTMKEPVVAVFDRKTALYDKPHAIRHTGDAIREFEHLLKDPKTRFGMNPDDFILRQIATFDPNDGSYTNITPPVDLASGTI